MSVWSNRNFRLFFAGQLISNCGTWLQNVAQGVLMEHLTGRSFMVGVTSAAMFLPVLFLALPGGRLADRFDRRRLLVATQVLALAATAVLALLAFTGRATPAAVIVVALLVGVQYAASVPAMFALLPQLVGPEDLGEAVGMNSVTYNLARVLGPGVATAAIASVGFGWAFAINSLSFVALIVALLLLRLEPGQRRGDGAGPARDAITYVLEHRRVLLMLAGVASLGIASDPITTLSPAFAHDVFGRRVADAGLVVGAFGVGAITAAFAFSRMFRLPAATRYRLLPVTSLAFAAGLVGFAFIPSFWPALAAAVVGGAGFVASVTTWTTGIQEEVPERLRGRVMALWTLAFLGTRPFAALLDGALADRFSPKLAVVVLCLPLVAVAVLGAPRLKATAPASAGRRPDPGTASVPPGP